MLNLKINEFLILLQVLSRLFPFKRGLCHAYWAPNFWAIYNMLDKIASIVFKITPNTSSNTGGLVQEYEHQYLPVVRPIATFVLTFVAILPCVLKIAFSSYSRWVELAWIYCAISYQYLIESFQSDSKIGLHTWNCYMWPFFIHVWMACTWKSHTIGVHSIEVCLLILNEMNIRSKSELKWISFNFSLLLTQNSTDAKQTLFLSVVANYSLFPLLFTANLLVIKSSLFLLYTIILVFGIHSLNLTNGRRFILSWLELFYVVGLFGIFVYEICIQYVFKLDSKLPFLPLLLTSVYCSIGVIYFWLSFYINFLLSRNSCDPQTKIAKKKIKWEFHWLKLKDFLLLFSFD